MTDQEIIIEVAKLDGWAVVNRTGNGPMAKMGASGWIPLTHLPPYLTSRDAIIPVIAKLPKIQYIDFVAELQILQFGANLGEADERMVWEMLCIVEPKSYCIALLKATGKWKDNE